MNIKELREQAGLTQSQLAALVQCDARTIQRYEAAGAKVPAPMLELIRIKLKELSNERCGYVCKACGNPSPLGIGYASHGKAAWLASQSLSECACGHSVKP